MKKPGVAWFDGVSRDELGNWVLEAVTLDRGNLERRIVPFSESLGMDMTSPSEWSQMRMDTFFEEACIFLGNGQRLMDTAAVVRNIWPGLAVSNRHAIFRFDVGESIYLVPALFLIGRLFLSVRSVARYLLQPGMFESFIDPAPVVKSGEVHLRLPPHISVNQCSEGLARALAWLAVDRSAERAWRSVWFKAMSGRIDFDLPTVRLHGRFGGIEVDGMRLVTWSREVTANTAVPNLLWVTSRRGTQKLFKRGGCV